MANSEVRQKKMPPRGPRNSNTPKQVAQKTYTTPEMAKLLGVTSATIRKYARDPDFLKPTVVYRGQQKLFQFTQTHAERWPETLKKKLEDKRQAGS